MRKVLVAEDEPALLEFFRELVEGLGHECLEARDGIEAVSIARSQFPDLVITDYMMPGSTGIELIRALREDPRLRHVPTVLMTAGRPPLEQRTEPWLFLHKPVALEEFERAVREGLKAADESHPRTAPAETRDRISELSLAREDMLSWVSHEIKSPLAAAAMATQLALRKAKSGEPGKALERHLVITARQLARMDELVTSILDAAQLRDGRLKLELERIDVGEWLRKIVAFWKELQPDYELRLRQQSGTISIVGDPERLRQIIDNLISNAIKYGQPSKTVHIDLCASAREVTIAVQDFGRGISPDEQTNIFDRFHRLPGQVGGGHGLGLYIASALARLHHGGISLHSELGKGSTFTLSLPTSLPG
jgi:two-component system sensor histidine kinase/response regulator